MGISKGSYGTDLVIKNSVLIKCKTDERRIEIPSSVKSIGDSAFKNCRSLTNVIIPDSVINIGDHAFESCESLTSISIPDSVINIGKSAFQECSSITSVTIGNAVTSIGANAFYRCTSLASVTIGNAVTSIGANAFYRCASLASVTFGDRVSSIGFCAFDMCRNLTSIVIPEAVTSIEYGTFRGCISLESVIMGNSVEQIERQAFYYCKSLKNVTIPDSISFIHKEAFDRCYYTTISLPKSYKRKTGEHQQEVRDRFPFLPKDRFKDCENVIFRPDSPVVDLASASDLEMNLQIEKPEEIGDSLKNDDQYNSSSLNANESASIGASNNSYGTDLVIKRNVLTKCKTGESCIEVPIFVNRIGPSAFKDCVSLTSVIIPDSVTSIGNKAFENCRSLVGITIPDSVISIGESAFRFCESLTTITIGTSVSAIGDFTFVGCKSITSIVIPESVTIINCGLFRSCVSLSSVTLGNSITRISAGAFRDCISLTSITIPDSIRAINSVAFEGCTNLTIAIPRSYRFRSVKKKFPDCKKVIYKKNRDVVNEVHSGNLTTDISERTLNDSEISLAEVSDSTIDKSSKDELLTTDKYVFISYSSKNQNYAEATLHLLKDEQIGVWMAPYDIPAGSKYAHVINNAIKDCSCVLLLLSEQSQASEWVDKEIERACSYKKTIISMHLDESQLNAGFSFYLGNQQIVPVKTIDQNNPNVIKVLNAIRSFLK